MADQLEKQFLDFKRYKSQTLPLIRLKRLEQYTHKNCPRELHLFVSHLKKQNPAYKKNMLWLIDNIDDASCDNLKALMNPNDSQLAILKSS
jgi:hypothetical protein